MSLTSRLLLLFGALGLASCSAGSSQLEREVELPVSEHPASSYQPPKKQRVVQSEYVDSAGRTGTRVDFYDSDILVTTEIDVPLTTRQGSIFGRYTEICQYDVHGNLSEILYEARDIHGVVTGRAKYVNRFTDSSILELKTFTDLDLNGVFDDVMTIAVHDARIPNRPGVVDDNVVAYLFGELSPSGIITRGEITSYGTNSGSRVVTNVDTIKDGKLQSSKSGFNDPSLKYDQDVWLQKDNPTVK